MPYVTDEAGEIRASDGERQEIAARLNDAVGKGQLTLAEFSERVDTALAARTRGELEQVVADLPAAAVPAAAPVAAPAGAAAERPKAQWSVALVGGTRRTGRWRVPERSIGVSIVGGADLNMRDAELSAPRVEITRYSLIGGVQLKVPRGVRIEVGGVTLIGGKDIRVDEAAVPPGAPVIALRVFTLLGGVSVRTVG